ncbi:MULTISPECIES: hypothetical protein [unclassified Paenibacillus]|uniref:hypothetical protein n=1 Tax=unclassified Paenibacillus TaxID=185978 RepID=UPI00111568F8|nr:MULTISPECIES: hypothetical protein [unclassified Paenibacillus]QID16087.1 hypothetical protein CIC07_25525 [Paenibacillus sp. RUD330]
MADISAITRQYAKAVFLNQSRTLSSVPVSQREGTIKYAAGSYFLDEIKNALDAGTIMQEVYDEVLMLNPDILNRPVLAELFELG